MDSDQTFFHEVEIKPGKIYGLPLNGAASCFTVYKTDLSEINDPIPLPHNAAICMIERRVTVTALGEEISFTLQPGYALRLAVQRLYGDKASTILTL